MKNYRFKAKIESAPGGGAYVLFPYDTEKEFGTKGKVPVKATFDGVPYTGSLIKYGQPQHMLGLLKSIREQVGKGPGDTIDVTIQRDELPRVVEIPPAFQKLLKKEGLLRTFETLSYTHRKEYCRWITEAKKEETRFARLTKAIEMLKKGIKTPRVNPRMASSVSGFCLRSSCAATSQKQSKMLPQLLHREIEGLNRTIRPRQHYAALHYRQHIGGQRLAIRALGQPVLHLLHALAHRTNPSLEIFGDELVCRPVLRIDLQRQPPQRTAILTSGLQDSSAVSRKDCEDALHRIIAFCERRVDHHRP